MKIVCLVLLIALTGGAALGDQPAPKVSKPNLLEKHEKDGVHFTKLDSDVWLHTTYATIEGWGTFPSNGLIILANGEATLVDTAWTNKQTETIVSWTKEVLGTPITSAVFTHAHNDKMGGVDVIKKIGAATYAHPLSNVIAPTEGLVPAEFDLTIQNNGAAVLPEGRPKTDLPNLDIFYAGSAHTVDNIVIRIMGTDILFGGCLIRPSGAKSLGNAKEELIPDWSVTIERISNRYLAATTIIPSHGPPAGRELLNLTSELAQKATR